MAPAGAEQLRDRVAAAVLAHVEADHPVAAAEQELGQRLGELGLADAGRPDEEERRERLARVLEPRLEDGDEVDDLLDRVRLPEHALLQERAHVGAVPS